MGYVNCKLENEILDSIYENMLEYFKHYVSFNNFGIRLYNSEWQYDKVGRVIYNSIYIENTVGDDYEDEIEITVGLSKDYDGYFISNDTGKSIKVDSSAYSLGTILDNLAKDYRKISDELTKGIEKGVLV